MLTVLAFRCVFALAITTLMVTKKISNQGENRGIFNPNGKFLGQSGVDHPRFKID